MLVSLRQTDSVHVHQWYVSAICVRQKATADDDDLYRQRRYLQVKVGDLFGVQVEDPIKDLLEELSGFLLTQRLLLCQEVKELPAGHTGRRRRERENLNVRSFRSEPAPNPYLTELS